MPGSSQVGPLRRNGCVFTEADPAGCRWAGGNDRAGEGWRPSSRISRDRRMFCAEHRLPRWPAPAPLGLHCAPTHTARPGEGWCAHLPQGTVSGGEERGGQFGAAEPCGFRLEPARRPHPQGSDGPGRVGRSPEGPGQPRFSLPGEKIEPERPWMSRAERSRQWRPLPLSRPARRSAGAQETRWPQLPVCQQLVAQKPTDPPRCSRARRGWPTEGPGWEQPLTNQWTVVYFKKLLRTSCGWNGR
jgi:hypothetical protein